MPDAYSKHPLTFVQQLNQLEARGLTVADRPQALETLASISYYRLSAYWHPFRIRDKNQLLSSQLRPGTGFDDVIELYEFDRQLRSLLLDAIERIEVSVRTRITYHMSHTYGAFAHTNPAHFHSGFSHGQWLTKLEDETRRSSDEFIRHYKAKYQGFPTVPTWMLTELMSFGSLSIFYKGLQNDQKAGIEDKKAVASYFGLHHKRLGNWLHTLTYVRNVCAHHSRLWNRELAIRPDKSKDPQWSAPMTPRNDRIFYVLLMLRKLLRTADKNSDWHQRTTALLDPIATNDFYRKAMGMPENWKEHPLWV